MSGRAAPLFVVALLLAALLQLAVAALAPPAHAAPPGVAATTSVMAQSDVLAQAAGTVTGRVRAGTEPLVGVVLIVSQDGTEVARTETDAEGSWSVAVPSAGTYDVTIDTASLPDGVALRDPDVATKSVDVANGESKGVLFPIAVEIVTPGFFERAINFTFSGLRLGSVIALTSVGLSLIFGVTGLVNFAHGELVTFGAIAAYYVNNRAGLPLILGAVIALVLGGALGGALESGLFKPLRRRKTSNVSLIVITIGLSFVMRNIFQMSGVFGTAPQSYTDYALQEQLNLGPLSITPRDLLIIIVSLLVLGAVGAFLQATTLGKAMRAVADNKDLAESSGIDVQRVILTVWILGGGLAALGGVMQALSSSAVEFDMGFALLLLMFAGIVVGGLGTAYGAMAGGLLVGLSIEVSVLFISVQFKTVIAFLLLITVLLVKPQGLLGRAERFG